MRCAPPFSLPVPGQFVAFLASTDPKAHFLASAGASTHPVGGPTIPAPSARARTAERRLYAQTLVRAALETSSDVGDDSATMDIASAAAESNTHTARAVQLRAASVTPRCACAGSVRQKDPVDSASAAKPSCEGTHWHVRAALRARPPAPPHGRLSEVFRLMKSRWRTPGYDGAKSTTASPTAYMSSPSPPSPLPCGIDSTHGECTIREPCGPATTGKPTLLPRAATSSLQAALAVAASYAAAEGAAGSACVDNGDAVAVRGCTECPLTCLGQGVQLDGGLRPADANPNAGSVDATTKVSPLKPSSGQTTKQGGRITSPVPSHSPLLPRPLWLLSGAAATPPLAQAGVRASPLSTTSTTASTLAKTSAINTITSTPADTPTMKLSQPSAISSPGCLDGGSNSASRADSTGSTGGSRETEVDVITPAVVAGPLSRRDKRRLRRATRSLRRLACAVDIPRDGSHSAGTSASGGRTVVDGDTTVVIPAGGFVTAPLGFCDTPLEPDNVAGNGADDSSYQLAAHSTRPSDARLLNSKSRAASSSRGTVNADVAPAGCVEVAGEDAANPPRGRRLDAELGPEDTALAGRWAEAWRELITFAGTNGTTDGVEAICVPPTAGRNSCPPLGNEAAAAVMTPRASVPPCDDPTVIPPWLLHDSDDGNTPAVGASSGLTASSPSAIVPRGTIAAPGRAEVILPRRESRLHQALDPGGIEALPRPLVGLPDGEAVTVAIAGGPPPQAKIPKRLNPARVGPYPQWGS